MHVHRIPDDSGLGYAMDANTGTRITLRAKYLHLDIATNENQESRVSLYGV